MFINVHKVLPLTIMGVAYTAIGTEIWRVTYLRSSMMKYCIVYSVYVPPTMNAIAFILGYIFITSNELNTFMHNITPLANKVTNLLLPVCRNLLPH